MMDLHRPWRVCKGKPVITDVLTLQYYRNWPFSGFRDSCGSLDRRSAFVRIRMYFCIRFCYKPSWKINNKNGLLKARLPKRDLKVNILTSSLCEDTVAISLRTYCGPTKWLIHNSMRLRLCGGYNQKKYYYGLIYHSLTILWSQYGVFLFADLSIWILSCLVYLLL